MSNQLNKYNPNLPLVTLVMGSNVVIEPETYYVWDVDQDSTLTFSGWDDTLNENSTMSIKVSKGSVTFPVNTRQLGETMVPGYLYNVAIDHTRGGYLVSIDKGLPINNEIN